MTDPRTLIDPVRSFLAAPRCAVLATLASSGAPRQVVVHYTLQEDHLQLNARRDRGWVAHLDRDPRVALIVHDAGNDQHYVSIRGTARRITEGAAALEDAMRQAERYGEAPTAYAGQARVTVRLDPGAVYEYR
jgi:PPOX class probable F420-dependent enzyme